MITSSESESYVRLFHQRLARLEPVETPFFNGINPAERFGLVGHGANEVVKYAEVVLAEVSGIGLDLKQQTQLDFWLGAFTTSGYLSRHRQILDEFNFLRRFNYTRGLIFQTGHGELILTSPSLDEEVIKEGPVTESALASAMRRYNIKKALGSNWSFETDVNDTSTYSLDITQYEQGLFDGILNQFAVTKGLTNTEFLRLRLAGQYQKERYN